MRKTLILTLSLSVGGAQCLAGALLQAPTNAELAVRMTGRWKLNKELSPAVGSGGEGRRGRGASFSVAPGTPQRGGRGGGEGAPGFERPMVTTEEAAAQAALAVIQQVPLEMTIDATVAELNLVEPRGPSLFKIDGKNTPIEVPGGRIKVKSKWDRGKLNQEFSSALQALVRSWSVDADGRLVLTQHLQSPTFNSKPVRALYDRQ
jgi:hypothetical protein